MQASQTQSQTQVPCMSAGGGARHFSFARRIVATTACSSRLDVVLLMDGSRSIEADQWVVGMDFVNRIVGSFDVREEAAHIGIIQFSTEARVELELTADEKALTAAVSSMQQQVVHVYAPPDN